MSDAEAKPRSRDGKWGWAELNVNQLSAGEQREGKAKDIVCTWNVTLLHVFNVDSCLYFEFQYT